MLAFCPIINVFFTFSIFHLTINAYGNKNIDKCQIIIDAQIHHLFPNDPCCYPGWVGFLKDYPKNGITG